MTITVLLVDDSAVIRGLMSKALSADPVISIIGTASNGAMAISMAQSYLPDIIVLDVEMPVMDGLIALPEIFRVSPKSKIIMASTLTERNASISLQALSLGAADYIAKPSARVGSDVENFYRELIGKVKALAPVGHAAVPLKEREPVHVPVVAPPKPMFQPHPSAQIPLASIKALAIASSTGGPQALLALLGQINGHLKNIPIFITQHMPPTFTTILAEHLTKAGGRNTTEGKNGEVARAGYAYIAPGDYHMVVEKNVGGEVIIRINQDAQENFCRPAADPMLRSLSAIYGKHLLVIVLTGMGQDGMEGSKIVVQHGGNVIAQDEASSVVYGMPKAVVENKLCRAVLPLSQIGPYLISQMERP